MCCNQGCLDHASTNIIGSIIVNKRVKRALINQTVTTECIRCCSLIAFEGTLFARPIGHQQTNKSHKSRNISLHRLRQHKSVKVWRRTHSNSIPEHKFPSTRSVAHAHAHLLHSNLVLPRYSPGLFSSTSPRVS